MWDQINMAADHISPEWHSLLLSRHAHVFAGLLRLYLPNLFNMKIIHDVFVYYRNYKNNLKNFKTQLKKKKETV